MGVSCMDPNYHVCRFSPLIFLKIFACLNVGTDLYFSHLSLSLSLSRLTDSLKSQKGIWN